MEGMVAYGTGMWAANSERNRYMRQQYAMQQAAAQRRAAPQQAAPAQHVPGQQVPLPPVPLASPPPVHARPRPPQETSITGRLRELAQLHANGVLTDEEFVAAKQQILSTL
jgi:hypothetical protein